MNKTLVGVIAFVTGAAIGSVTSWQLLKKYYEQISREEVDSVKEVYARKMKEYEHTHEMNNEESKESTVADDIDSNSDSENDEISVMEYAKILSKQGYTNYSNSEDIPMVKDTLAIQTNDEENEYLEPDGPYVIPPEDFGDEEEYERITLTYYSDNVLADDNDQRIVDIENIVGYDALESFGEYEDDAVHVINDRLRSYFEILKDERTYDEALKNKPYLTEG